MKKKEETQISFGHKHVWTDTSGHAHRVVFDEKTIEKPRTTWIVLSTVTLLATAIGLVGVYTAPPRGDAGPALRVSGPNFDFAVKTTIAKEDPPARVLCAGWNDEFFTSSDSGTTLYDAAGQKLGFWANESGKEPTAIAFDFDERSSNHGALLVAYGDTIQALRFSLEKVVPGEGESVYFTGQDGAVGPFETLLEIPGAEIRGLALSPDRLFVADYNARYVARYSWKKLESLHNAEEKRLVPDCAIGEADEATGYSGLKPAFDKNFSVAYSASNNELLAANSGLLRVDLFNANTGVFIADCGAPHVETALGFDGDANPVAIAAGKSDWFAAAESGTGNAGDGSELMPTLSFFSMDGSLLKKNVLDGARDDAEASIADLGISPDGNRAYALYSNGEIDVLETPNN